MTRSDMDEIKRIGSPRAIDTRDEEVTVSVTLNAPPSPEWVHFFREFPSESTSMCHPKLIDVEGSELIFTSAERYFGDWIRLIDKWMSDANRKYQEYLEALRRKQQRQEEQVQEQQRRIQDATEKLRGL